MLPASSASSHLCSSCLPELCSHRLTRFSDRNKSNVRTLRNLKNTAKQLCLRRSKIFYCTFALKIIQEGKNIPYCELVSPLSFLPPPLHLHLSFFPFPLLPPPPHSLVSSASFFPISTFLPGLRQLQENRYEGKMES